MASEDVSREFDSKLNLSKSITNGLLGGRNLLASSIPLLNCNIDSVSVNIFSTRCAFIMESNVPSLGTLVVGLNDDNKGYSRDGVCCVKDLASRESPPDQ
ncbi:hypothetical protein HanXRQr2_Chr11g0492211 [Helianthus annuus]|uniref:Uncharacterized protein n=1 Tax=Helianthus annuus TaxID=4232 RepID=A0A9K3HPK1_HELAN|nr:hypothetical protein HanXRQr2_Chr11g0492211 [Helianthus annuus]KAJ0875283.1 hypothetical protein HanPSC8_Chr11g0474341 [Helianthus annuus]